MNPQGKGGSCCSDKSPKANACDSHFATCNNGYADVSDEKNDVGKVGAEFIAIGEDQVRKKEIDGIKSDDILIVPEAF